MRGPQGVGDDEFNKSERRETKSKTLNRHAMDFVEPRRHDCKGIIDCPFFA